MKENFLLDKYNINNNVQKLFLEAEKNVAEVFKKIDETAFYNSAKVLSAFQKNNISEAHFAETTGYGYDDIGREAIDCVFAEIFGAEDALVRHNIISGTHALTLCLFGVLRPNDTLISVTGKPYDTLEEVIGIRGKSNGSLKDFGINYSQVDLKNDGNVDYDQIEKAVNENTKAVLIQKSKGYDFRKSLSCSDIEKIVNIVKSKNKNTICIVDNCYGEFVEKIEPTNVGADLIVGSLIKNPGGGLCKSGGYIAGKKELVKLVSYRLTAPGIGKKCGASLGFNRSLFQGLFMAPSVVSASLKGAVLCAEIFEKLGYNVEPKANDERFCIIEAIQFNKKEPLIAFCQGIQKGAPIDSFATPLPWDMPGYENEVIMAAGAFVSGSSIELSCDAPIKPPYIAYMQGGLTYDYAKLGIMKAVEELFSKGILN